MDFSFFNLSWDFSTFRELLGFCVGLLYLWWEYHADSKVWLASVVMPMISMWIYFSKGLYADFAINIYYLVIAAYGYVHWTRRKNNSHAETGETTEKKPTTPISHTPLKTWVGIILTAGILWYAIWWLLTSFTDSTVPIADSFTTALSIIGLWMLAQKYVEQWLVWFVVDIVCSCLYFYKGLPFYCILYAIYTIIALLGYHKWLRLMHSENNLTDK